MTSPSHDYEQLPPPVGAPPANGPPVQARPAGTDATVGELASQLGAQVSRLVRDELALAQLEAKERTKKVGVGAGMFGVSGLFAFLGACCGVAAAVLGLVDLLRPWAAAIAVALILFVLAGLIALPGWKTMTSRRPAVPKDSIDSVKADVSAVRAAMHK